MKAKTFSALAASIALSFGGVAVASDAISELQDADKQIHDAAARTQATIDKLDDQNQDLLGDYRRKVDETETLRAYNDHVARLVEDQKRAHESLRQQIAGIQATAQGVVPLMYRMIDTIDQFVQIDVPFLADERADRIQRLHDVMDEANTSTAEKYRLILEAYQIENEYGTRIGSYRGTLEIDGEELVVDYFYAGRVSFMAQSLDQTRGWVWDNDARNWNAMQSGQMRDLSKAIAMANQQSAPDLIKLPIKVAK
ncbi:DUF3450 domain-containing protein [Ferrimonas marina]|uniref:TonB system biopolymer transport component n=1 Tax=Ferrimonas marina TaxID=299255 RepID=A0A1M5YS22_9GAMM|nr:DUF3450 domain-containing protein [Ferrimonas marina]SHI14771.1 Protein of unknown function [Ferrimonas marina]